MNYRNENSYEEQDCDYDEYDNGEEDSTDITQTQDLMLEEELESRVDQPRDEEFNESSIDLINQTDTFLEMITNNNETILHNIMPKMTNDENKCTKQDHDEDELIFREYQLDMFNQGKGKNSIIYLETGLGKTLIIIMFMWQQLMTYPNKKIVFLANTIQLVEQQAQQISIKLPRVAKLLSDDHKSTELAKKYIRRMKVIHGSKYPDTWNKSRWRYVFESNSIFVVTSQIFLNMLRKGQMKMNELSFIAFDECHAASSDHQYNLIMKEFYFQTKMDLGLENRLQEMPQLVGATASPVINSKSINSQQVFMDLLNLAANLDSMFVYSDEEIVKGHLKEAKVEHLPYDIVLGKADIQKYLDNGLNQGELRQLILEQMNSQKYLNEYFQLTRFLEDFLRQNRQDPLICNVVIQLQEYLLDRGLHIYLELGQYAIVLTLDLVISKMKQFRSSQMVGLNTSLFDLFINQLISLQRDCEIKYKNINESISPKVRVLVEFLQQIYGKDPKSMALIFIKQRLSAYYLDKLLMKCFQHSGIAGVKSGYIIGQHGKPAAVTKVEAINFVVDDQRGTLVNNLMQELNIDDNKFSLLNEKEKSMKILLLEQHLNVAEQKSILKDFRSQKINILISTSVAEEGIDIPMCNFVICFNSVASSKAFVQMKGRARKADSRFIIMMPEQKDSAKSQTHQQVQLYTKQQIKDLIMPIRREKVLQAITVLQKKSLADTSYEYYIIQQSGACINSNWSVQLINSFCQSIELEGGTRGQPKYAIFQINQEKTEPLYLAFILLPLQINKFICYGLKHKTVKAARASAAVIAAKQLYQNGYMDEELRPTLLDNIGCHLGADEEDQTIEQTGEQIKVIRKYCRTMVKKTHLLGLTLKVCQRFYQSTLNICLKSSIQVFEYMKCNIQIDNVKYLLATPKLIYENLIEAKEILGKHKIYFLDVPQIISLDEFTNLFEKYKEQVISQFNLIQCDQDIYQEIQKHHQYKFMLSDQAFLLCYEQGSLDTAFTTIIRAINAYNCSKALRTRDIRPTKKVQVLELDINDILLKIPQFIRDLASYKAGALKLDNVDIQLAEINQSIIVPNQVQQNCQIMSYFDDMLIKSLDADNVNRAQIIYGMTYFKMLVALQVYANYQKTDIRITHVRSKTIMSPTYLKNCLIEVQIFQYLNKTDSNNSLLTKLTQIVRPKDQNADKGLNFEQRLNHMDRNEMIIQNNAYYSHFSIANFVNFLYGSFGYIKSKVEDQQLKDGFQWLQLLNICKLESHLESTEELVSIRPKEVQNSKQLQLLRQTYSYLEANIQYSFNHFEFLFRALTDVSFKFHMNNKMSQKYSEKFQSRDEKVQPVTDEVLQQFITEANQINGSDQNSYCNQIFSFLGKYLWNYAIHPQLQDNDPLKMMILRKIFGSIPFQAYMAIRLRLDIYLNVGASKQINDVAQAVINNGTNSMLFHISQLSVSQGTEMLANAFRALVAAIYFDCGCDFAELSNWCWNICLKVNCAQLFHDDYIRRQPRYQFLKWYEVTLKQDPFNFKLLRTPHQDYKKEAHGIMLFIPFDSSKSEIVNLLQDKFYDITQLHIYEKSRNKAWEQLLKFIPDKQKQ